MALVVLLLSVLITAHIVQAMRIHHREEEFAKIVHYELIHFNIQLFQSAHIIKFNAFNTHYEVQLVPNHDMIPSNIRHANINPTAISSAHGPYFTSLSKTCHFFGHVLNTVMPSKVSLSLCNKRGIRGRVVAFNDTLIIQPSAYYLDRDKDKHGYHDISDEHLIYRLSDFNSTFVVEHDVSDFHTLQPEAPLFDPKRRMLQNNGIHKVEVLILNDAFRTQQYIKDYAHQWYEQLVADYVDIINIVSNDYYTTDWGTDVGEIRVYLVELEVIFQYTGRHEMLSPPLIDPECQWSEFYCPINSGRWLSALGKWLSYYKYSDTYDYAHLVTNGRFESDRSGLGINGKMCKGVASSGLGMNFEGTHRLARTIAHELGHDFGMWHDSHGGGERPADYGYDCPLWGTHAGIMGAELHGFSNCSIKDLHDWLTTNDVSCLGTNVTAFSSNHVPDPSTTALPATTQKNVVLRPPPDTAICIGMQGFDIVNKTHLDGEWWNVGTHHNRSIYSKDSYILYYNRSMWIISSSFSTSSTDIIGYCMQPKIEQCHNKFNIHVPVQNMMYKKVNHTEIYDCYPLMQDSDEDDAWGCIQFWGFDMQIYDGYWSEFGYNQGQPMYTKDGYYLYYSAHNSIMLPVWLISTVAGGDYSDSETVANCFETDVTQCGFGHFRVLNQNNAWVVRKHSMIARCDYNPIVNNTCIFHDCLAIDGMKIGRNGREYNGIWRPAGCHNGQAYYISNGDMTVYLYYSYVHWIWIISDKLESEVAEAYCPKAEIWGKNGSIDIMDTTSGWYVLSDTGWGWLVATVTFTPCAALTEQHNVVCLQPSGYTDTLCVNGYDNNTKWQYTFHLYTKLCSNKKPIYYSIVTNDSDVIPAKDAFGNVEIQRTYYLYYMMEHIYPDSDEMEGKWVISEDKLSTRGVAFCVKEHVFECTEHSWRVQSVYDDYMMDETMTVNNGECRSISSGKTHVAQIVIWIAVLFIIVCLVTICVYCVCRKTNQNKANKTVDSMGAYVNQGRNVDNEEEEKVGIEVVQYPDATNQQLTSFPRD